MVNVNYPLFVSEFSATFNILDKITRNMQISNLMKIRPLVAEVFHADGRRDIQGVPGGMDKTSGECSLC